MTCLFPNGETDRNGRERCGWYCTYSNLGCRGSACRTAQTEFMRGRETRTAEKGQLCVVDGCCRGDYALGLCRTHYARAKRTGDPERLLQQPRDCERCGRTFHTTSASLRCSACRGRVSSHVGQGGEAERPRPPQQGIIGDLIAAGVTAIIYDAAAAERGDLSSVGVVVGGNNR